MSAEQDPLESYLTDMLDEGALAEQASPPAPQQVQASEARPTSDEGPVADWWGFGVAHLILVVPGEAVAAVQESIPEGMAWCSGQFSQGRHSLGGETRLILDPAALILPEPHRKRLPPLAERAEGLVHLKQDNLSLITGSEPLPVNLESSEVRWREQAGDRPWLAGTVMGRSMVVLDVDGLVALAARTSGGG